MEKEIGHSDEKTSICNDRGLEYNVVSSSAELAPGITSATDVARTGHTWSSTGRQQYQAYELLNPACLQQYGGWQSHDMGSEDCWLSDGHNTWFARCVGHYEMQSNELNWPNVNTQYSQARPPPLP